PNVAEAQRITIGLGQTLNELNLALTTTRTSRITGSATDSAGKPLSGGMVMAMQTGGMFMMSAMGQIKPDGSFTLSGLAPGDYTLRAYSMGGFGDLPELAVARVTVGGEDVTGVQLAGMKPVTVTGRI